jgi:hypothetical protein
MAQRPFCDESLFRAFLVKHADWLADSDVEPLASACAPHRDRTAGSRSLPTPGSTTLEQHRLDLGHVDIIGAKVAEKHDHCTKSGTATRLYF